MFDKLLMSFLFLFVISTSTEASDSKKEFAVFLRDGIFENYSKILDGRNIEDIEPLTEIDGLSRTRLEAIVFDLAVNIGGCNCDLKINPYPVQTTHARSIEQVRLGIEISHPIAGFSDDSRYNEADFYKSLPILSGSDFYVGIYVHEDREDLLSITDPEAIKSLRFAVGAGWEVDNAVLDRHELPKVQATSWDNLIDMLVVGRADAVLQPFRPGADMGFVDKPHNAKFLPIPNMKMLFNSDRQYFVSKRHPDGKMFLDALNRGIEKLSENDGLKKAHAHAGVIRDDIDDYIEIFKN